ncbi:MAG: hypothetical protein ACK53Y_20065, partial [bacterium]
MNESNGEKISLSLPRFNRVRVVKVIQVEEDTEAFMCNCNFTTQWGMPCRHVVFLNRQQLSLQQFDVQWLKVYSSILIDKVFTYCELFYFGRVRSRIT